MNNLSNPETNQNIEESSIDLWGILDWLLAHWKTLLGSALAGLALGLSTFYLIAPYAVKATVINNGAADFLGWRNLKTNLPILASKILRTRQFDSPEERQQFIRMSTSDWWTKNFVPTFAVSKADTKDLLPQSTDLRELGATKILNFVLTATGDTSEQAIRGAEIETQFFVSGSTYFALKALINGYSAAAVNDSASLQKSISDAKVNLIALREKSKSLKALADRYKDQRSGSTTLQSIGNSNQTIAANAANSKYLPLNTQLIAVESDIDQQTQLLEQSQGQLAEIRFLSEFLDQALPIVDQDYDGLKSVKTMLSILAEQRTKIAPDNFYALRKADAINSELTGILMSYSKTLDINIPPEAKRMGILKFLGGGFAGGLFLATTCLLFIRGLAKYKVRRSAKAL